MATYSQVIKGNKPQIVDLKHYTNVEIQTAQLVSKPEGAKKVVVYVSYIPVENGGERKKPVRKEEIIATFENDSTVTGADFIVTDEMEGSIYTLDGAEVKLSGLYLSFSDDEYGVPEEESVDEDFDEYDD